MFLKIIMGFKNNIDDEYYKYLKKYMIDEYDIYISPTIYSISDNIIIS